MRIQLLTFPGCPHAETARATLRALLATPGIAVEVEEVDTTAPDTPESLRRWGSPTVLIDGVDIEGEEPTGPSCRLYRDEHGRIQAGPSVSRLLRALKVGGRKLWRSAS